MMNFIFIPIDGPLRTYRGGVQPDEVTRLVHDSSSKICVLTMNYCTVVSSGVLRYADDDDGDEPPMWCTHRLRIIFYIIITSESNYFTCRF